MKNNLLCAIVVLISTLVGDSAQADNPFVGHWALTLPNGRAGWLGITEKNGKLSAAILWGGGSVKPAPSVEVEGVDIEGLRLRQSVEKMVNGGEPEELRRDLGPALEYGGLKPLASFYIALSYLREEKPGMSASLLEALCGEVSSVFELNAQYHLGIALSEMGDVARAVECLTQVAEHPLRNELGHPVEWALTLAQARAEQWEAALEGLSPLLC